MALEAPGPIGDQRSLQGLRARFRRFEADKNGHFGEVAMVEEPRPDRSLKN